MRFNEVINTKDFSIENLDLTEIQKITHSLPRGQVIDANIAEQHLVSTIEAQDLCQEKIAQVERWIGIKRIMLDKAEAESALIRAKEAGHKTVKEKNGLSSVMKQFSHFGMNLKKPRSANFILIIRLNIFQCGIIR